MVKPNLSKRQISIADKMLSSQADIIGLANPDRVYLQQLLSIAFIRQHNVESRLYHREHTPEFY